MKHFTIGVENGRSLRLFLRRARLRLAMRDLLGFHDMQAVGLELSHLADAAGEVALRLAADEVRRRAEFAMPRVGGRRLQESAWNPWG